MIQKFAPFRFWCYKVMPLVYDDSLSYYELLCKVVKQLNDVGENTNQLADGLVELKEYVDTYFESQDIQEMINKKLDDMAEDGTLERLIRNTVNLANGTVSIIPSVYVGDWIENASQYVPSACCKVGNYVYMLCSPVEDGAGKTAGNTNIGKVYKFNTSTNTIENGYPKYITVGHANGFCYDTINNVFYIAPVFRYDTGAKTRWESLLKYDANFTSYSEIPTVSSTMSVSFNHKTGEVLYYTYDRNIYKLVDSVSTLVTPVTFNGYEYDINQGFACYDDYFLISSPAGNILFGYLDDGKITFERMVDMYDYGHYMPLGELEDFEFDENGRLYAQRYIRPQADLMDCIVTEICLTKVASYPRVTFTKANHTYTLTDASASKFKNSMTELKHLSQINLYATGENVNNVSVNCSKDMGNVILAQDMCITVNGNFKFTSLQVRKGHLNIYNESNANLITCTGSPSYGEQIIIARTGRLSLTGQYALNFTIENADHLKINIGYYVPITVIRLAPNINSGTGHVYIGGVDKGIESAGMYYGTTKV